MIALALSKAWDRYYASSPFLNMLRGKHPRFDYFHALPHEVDHPEYQEKVLKCEAVVCDDVLVQKFSFYKNGPIFMIGGDPHAHTPQQVQRLECEYSSCDYVLTGAVFSKKLSPPYLYPGEHHRAKHIYFPHMVADERIYPIDWKTRRPLALLSGSISKEVYPFRYACRELGRNYAEVDLMGLCEHQHDAYFEQLARYRAAVTCNSVFEYTVAKYFEIPWTGAVLIAPNISEEERELIGFEHVKNALFAAAPNNVLDLVRVLNEDRRGHEIAEAGQTLMRKHHTARQRLEYVARLVDMARTQRLVPDSAKDCFLRLRLEE